MSEMPVAIVTPLTADEWFARYQEVENTRQREWIEWRTERDKYETEIETLRAHRKEMNDTCEYLRGENRTMRDQLAELETIKIQVDDVLVVNWIPLKDNDYRQALAQLVENAIQEHDDPAIGLVAQKRADLINKLAVVVQAAEFDYDPARRDRGYMTSEYYKQWHDKAVEALKLLSETP